VTDPFPPLHGREFTLIAHRQNWGEDRVFFVDDHGQLVPLPAPWTGPAPPDPCVIVARFRSAFGVADLRERARLLERPRRADGPTP
jgi:hypothetical protein